MRNWIIVPLLLITTLFLDVPQCSAQAHQKGDVDLSPGIGVGNYGWYNYGRRNYGIPLVFYADFGVHDYASVGPYGGLIIFDDVLGINFGARGIFHFWQLIDDKVSADLKADILDFYFSIFLGWEIFDNEFVGDRFRGGGLLGIRWYFVEHVALFAEVGGTPMGYSTLGVTFKIGKR